MHRSSRVLCVIVTMAPLHLYSQTVMLAEMSQELFQKRPFNPDQCYPQEEELLYRAGITSYAPTRFYPGTWDTHVAGSCSHQSPYRPQFLFFFFFARMYAVADDRLWRGRYLGRTQACPTTLNRSRGLLVLA